MDPRLEDLLKYRPVAENKAYYYNDQPNSFEHIFERNYVKRCYGKLLKGERPTLTCIGLWCSSKEMCLLLLLFHVQMPNVVWTLDVVCKTLIRNGYNLPLKYTEHLSGRPRAVGRRILKARSAFIVLRRRIVILLGIKAKRHKLPTIDRFVIKEIALEMWTERYTFHDTTCDVTEKDSYAHTKTRLISHDTIGIVCIVGFICCLFLLYQLGPLIVV